MVLPVINSHNSWSQLEEVWLGDVYPVTWYDHLPAETRDAFYQLTEITKEDLQVIQNKIESFGVKVRRPLYKNIDCYVNPQTGQLEKPQICPRDQFVTIGNKLIGHKWHLLPWQDVLDEYRQCSDCSIIETANYELNGANIVRNGKKLIIDTFFTKDKTIQEEFLAEYDVTLITNGGHLDGCFAILKPGLLLANNYFSDYDTFFPGWEKIILTNPEFYHHTTFASNEKSNAKRKALVNSKWWIPSLEANQSFNNHILEHAQTWVGNYTETYFELNCLVINESNVMMLGENPVLEKKLNKHGINVHWVPFRTRGFWDGGLHCLTVDIRRNSKELAQ